jgi:uncharacterized repeat protein (TIGR02543 family)
MSALPTRLAAALALAGIATTAVAQIDPIAYGSLSNFDVYNETEHETHGFEIELEDVSGVDIPYTFGGTYLRYGSPTVTDIPGGVIVRYAAAWDSATQQWSASTPLPATIAATDGHRCYQGGSPDYATSGCEHFGVSLSRSPTASHYFWLIEDPANPGTLIRNPVEITLSTPVWNVVPAAGGGQPEVEVEFEAPPKGDAKWLKVYKREFKRFVKLEELLSDNPIVPEQEVETETEWELIEQDPKKDHGGNHFAADPIDSGNKSVVRRYELYQYTGLYDAEHEPLCGGDGSCDVPQPGELGDFIGAQMAAANVGQALPARPTLIVARRGGGTVRSEPAGIALPTTGSATFDYKTSVTLKARPRRGYTFAGWTGACAGAGLVPQCTLVLTSATTRTRAVFQANAAR